MLKHQDFYIGWPTRASRIVPLGINFSPFWLWVKKENPDVIKHQDFYIGWPTRARTWTLLNQNQTCCQLHHRPIPFKSGANL